MINFLKRLLVISSLLGLTACGWMRGPGPCDDSLYRDSAGLPPLDVPADLDPPQQVAGQKIPDVGDNVQDASRNCLVEPPQILSERAVAMANEKPKKNRRKKKREAVWPTDSEALGEWVALDPEKPGVLGSNLGTMHGIATKDIGETLQGWAEALTNKQLAPYFSYYSVEYRPQDGRKFKKWRKQTEKELRETGQIELSVYGIRARPVSETRIQVSFFQKTKTDEVDQVVRKEMLMIREEGGWAILRERSVGA
ncbi:MAG: hypothetical protein AAF438_02505 [Pseudomonadota bacterium]